LKGSVSIIFTDQISWLR